MKPSNTRDLKLLSIQGTAAEHIDKKIEALKKELPKKPDGRGARDQNTGSRTQVIRIRENSP